MNENDLLRLVRSFILENLLVSPAGDGFRVRIPFGDFMGDPLDVFLTPTPDGGFTADDLGHTAGLLFYLAQHRENAPAHLLVKHLADAYGIGVDYNRGLLYQELSSTTDPRALLDFMKVLVSLHTAIPEMRQPRRERRMGSRLAARIGRDIGQLRVRNHVLRVAEVAGRHDTWVVDYKYTYKGAQDMVDVLIVAADLATREPRRKAEHVLTLAIDVLDRRDKPSLRVVYDVDGAGRDGSAVSAEKAAELIAGHQQTIGYKAYNYAALEERTGLKTITLQELSPMLAGAGM